jgi:hypothetical protein
MNSNEVTESEINSLRECNMILKEHMNYLRKKLKEKDEMLEVCIESMEKMRDLKFRENKIFNQNFYNISLN